jgi:hypothetical protein
MNTLLKSIIAGFVATFVLSIIMLIKAMMGLMPELNVIGMLSNMMGGSLAVGWIAHFMIGTIVWGGAFALLSHYQPNVTVLTGVGFGVAAWLLMMLLIMPMAGAGLFGLGLGMAAPVMTLMLHALYGAVLALTFNRQTLTSNRQTEVETIGATQ